MMPISPQLGLTISSFAVGIGTSVLCMGFGMLPFRAIIAGLLVFMTMRIFTGWLYERVGSVKK